MRGQHILASGENLTKRDDNQPRSIGRSKVLIDKRDDAICVRYYFFTCFFPFKYDVVIKLLCDEFFLSPIRMIEILTDKIDAIACLKKSKPTAKELSKDEALMHFNWSEDYAQKKAALLN